jgi:hypothetical protein
MLYSIRIQESTHKPNQNQTEITRKPHLHFSLLPGRVCPHAVNRHHRRQLHPAVSPIASSLYSPSCRGVIPALFSRCTQSPESNSRSPVATHREPAAPATASAPAAYPRFRPHRQVASLPLCQGRPARHGAAGHSLQLLAAMLMYQLEFAGCSPSKLGSSSSETPGRQR